MEDTEEKDEEEESSLSDTTSNLIKSSSRTESLLHRASFPNSQQASNTMQLNVRQPSTLGRQRYTLDSVKQHSRLNSKLTWVEKS